MLVVMTESTVLAKPLVHINCLENVCILFMIMSPSVSLSAIQSSSWGEGIPLGHMRGHSEISAPLQILTLYSILRSILGVWGFFL